MVQYLAVAEARRSALASQGPVAVTQGIARLADQTQNPLRRSPQMRASGSHLSLILIPRDQICRANLPPSGTRIVQDCRGIHIQVGVLSAGPAVPPAAERRGADLNCPGGRVHRGLTETQQLGLIRSALSHVGPVAIARTFDYARSATQLHASARVCPIDQAVIRANTSTNHLPERNGYTIAWNVLFSSSAPADATSIATDTDVVAPSEGSPSPTPEDGAAFGGWGGSTEDLPPSALAPASAGATSPPSSGSSHVIGVGTGVVDATGRVQGEDRAIPRAYVSRECLRPLENFANQNGYRGAAEPTVRSSAVPQPGSMGSPLPEDVKAEPSAGDLFDWSQWGAEAETYEWSESDAAFFAALDARADARSAYCRNHLDSPTLCSWEYMRMARNSERELRRALRQRQGQGMGFDLRPMPTPYFFNPSGGLSPEFPDALSGGGESAPPNVPREVRETLAHMATDTPLEGEPSRRIRLMNLTTGWCHRNIGLCNNLSLVLTRPVTGRAPSRRVSTTFDLIVTLTPENLHRLLDSR